MGLKRFQESSEFRHLFVPGLFQLPRSMTVKTISLRGASALVQGRLQYIKNHFSGGLQHCLYNLPSGLIQTYSLDSWSICHEGLGSVCWQWSYVCKLMGTLCLCVWLWQLSCWRFPGALWCVSGQCTIRGIFLVDSSENVWRNCDASGLKEC